MADNNDVEALNDIGSLPGSVLSTIERPLLHSRIEQYPPAKRSKADVFCTHCQRYVSDKTYKKHQRLYRYASNVTLKEEAGITQQDITCPGNTYYGQGRNETEVVSDNDGSGNEEMFLGTDSDEDNEQEEFEGITYGQGRKETEVVSHSDDSVSEETFLGTDSDEDNDEEFGGALINEEIEEIWGESCGVGELVEPLHVSVPVSPSTDIGASSKTTPAPIAALISWLTGFLLLLQAVHSTSDAVISALLKFLKVFFTVVGNFSSSVAELAKALPSSVFVLKTATNAHLGCTKFVVCPCCHKLYRFADCVHVSGGRETSAKCDFVRFPSHPHLRRRNPCGSFLLKSVTLPSGHKTMYPIKTYNYKTLQSSLQRLLLQPGFKALCRQWESRPALSNKAQDVYDGNIWKDFQIVDGIPFLASPDCLALGLMLNVDWFQPFKHCTYSVGAIYLTIMNLPRSIRYKRRNVILVGILSGPSEPKGNINSYLEPLVEELQDFWTGVTLEVNAGSSYSQSLVRCALLCVACDLPAGRKLCGFLSHSARLGCSKCYKKFPGTPGSMDYSGFKRESWLKRTDEEHRDRVHRVCQAKTKVEQNKLESTLGCRYSILLQLPYFDAPRMLTVDPMHNLFLGTGKHMLQFWLDNDVIPRSKFSHIQASVDKMILPSDVGRIPHKIFSGFSGFTADQFKNWIVLFSVPCLHEILPPDHLNCWRHFVLACRIICKRQLGVDDITLFDALLLRFCRLAEVVCGKGFITPNMHMHGHLKEVVNDYGPVYGFWLFSFERYNGILGRQSTNNREIEYQLLNRFVRDNLAYSFEFPAEFREDFKDVCCTDEHMVGSLHDTVLCCSSPSDVALPSVSTKGVLKCDDAAYLKQLYENLQPEAGPVQVNLVYVGYTSITLGGQKFGSNKSWVAAGARSFVAMAEWNALVFGPQPTPPPDPTHPDARFRPVKVKQYITVSFNVPGGARDYLLVAVVAWFLPHPFKHDIGKPATVWHHSQFECGGLVSFLPVRYLKLRCAHCVTDFKNQSVLVVVPLID